MGLIIGAVLYLGSKSPSARDSFNQSTATKPKHWTSTSSATRIETTGQFERSSKGFIPSDRCEQCGGAWIKHVNKKNGGRFFGCANYPRCKNTRDKQASNRQCSSGHMRTAANTLYDAAGRRHCLDCYPAQSPRRSPPRSHRLRISQLQKDPEWTNMRGRGREYCRNGHERTSANTYTRPDGERECRICRRNAR